MLGLLISQKAYECLERCKVAECELCKGLTTRPILSNSLNEIDLASSMLNRPKNLESFGYSKGSGRGDGLLVCFIWNKVKNE